MLVGKGDQLFRTDARPRPWTDLISWLWCVHWRVRSVTRPWTDHTWLACRERACVRVRSRRPFSKWDTLFRQAAIIKEPSDEKTTLVTISWEPVGVINRLKFWTYRGDLGLSQRLSHLPWTAAGCRLVVRVLLALNSLAAVAWVGKVYARTLFCRSQWLIEVTSSSAQQYHRIVDYRFIQVMKTTSAALLGILFWVKCTWSLRKVKVILQSLQWRYRYCSDFQGPREIRKRKQFKLYIESMTSPLWLIDNHRFSLIYARRRPIFLLFGR